MGTWLAISIAPRDPEQGARLIGRAFDVARRCERLMSRHDPASALNRVTMRAGRRPGMRERELAGILRAARRLSRRLGGAFDPTVAPLVEFWKRAEGRRAPSARSIERARALVGIEAIRIAGDRVSLARRGASLDLDGFGKGLALDRIAAELRRGGCTSAFLNFGESSLLALGRPPRGRWSVVLRHPFGGFAGTFTLSERACSTSSTLCRRLRVRGRAAGDVVDPRTGQPVARRAQVTVIARSGAAAEAISTALLVLGRAAVDDVARRMGADVCWIDVRGVHTTRGFRLAPVSAERR